MIVQMKDGSGSRKYRFITEDRDRHGKIRLYFRRPGQPKIRLHSPVGTFDFEQEYQCAMKGDVIIPPVVKARTEGGNTLRWLIEQYYSSADFQRLGKSTATERRRLLNHICDYAPKGIAWGTAPFATLQPEHIATLKDAFADRYAAANGRIIALQRLYAWACKKERNLAKENPAEEVELLEPDSPDGHKTWKEQDVQQYEDRHPIGTQARLALDLYLFTGVRISDVVRLGPQMEVDGKLHWVETKGAKKHTKEHYTPILPPLRRSIDATVTGIQSYLVTAYGKPWAGRNFSKRFSIWCQEAGLDSELTSHGVRKAAAVRCADEGASERELMAIFGWLNPEQASRYVEQANKKRLEARGAERLVAGGQRALNCPTF
jgi:integrase